MKTIKSTVQSTFLLPFVIAMFLACTTDTAASCFRSGLFSACAVTSEYSATVSCGDDKIGFWTCNSGVPSDNEDVQRCRGVGAAEFGLDLCQNNNDPKKCTYEKAVCGKTLGDCDFADPTTHIVESMSPAGGRCRGPRPAGGAQGL